MGVIDRSISLIKINLEDLDNSKNPEEAAQKLILELYNDLADVRIQLNEAIAIEKKIKARKDSIEEKIPKYEKAINKAIDMNTEESNEDARKLLITKKKLEEDLEGVLKDYQSVKNHTDAMREIHDELVDNIENLRQRYINVDLTKKHTAILNKSIKLNNVVSSSKNLYKTMEDKAYYDNDRVRELVILKEESSPLSELADKYIKE